MHRHALALANRFRAGVGLEPGDTAIVSQATDVAAADAIAVARIIGAPWLVRDFHQEPRESCRTGGAVSAGAAGPSARAADGAPVRASGPGRNAQSLLPRTGSPVALEITRAA